MPSARYWRIRATANSLVDHANYQKAVDVYTIQGFLAADATGPNLFLSPATATASSNNGSADASKAIDADDSTRWQTSYNPSVFQWWSIDLGSDAAVRSLRVLAHYNDDPGFVPLGRVWPAEFTLEASNDGTTWEAVAENVGTAEVSGWVTYAGLQPPPETPEATMTVSGPSLEARTGGGIRITVSGPRLSAWIAAELQKADAEMDVTGAAPTVWGQTGAEARLDVGAATAAGTLLRRWTAAAALEVTGASAAGQTGAEARLDAGAAAVAGIAARRNGARAGLFVDAPTLSGWAAVGRAARALLDVGGPALSGFAISAGTAAAPALRTGFWTLEARAVSGQAVSAVLHVTAPALMIGVARPQDAAAALELTGPRLLAALNEAGGLECSAEVALIHYRGL